ncbi:MAG TPA: energy transducer TonB [Candidatus Dormibacteraeota bacterium]|jgi:TonB family protein|nr:energy transducer TonB [Candidatus Dormibacteraeota bacterium]
MKTTILTLTLIALAGLVGQDRGHEAVSQSDTIEKEQAIVERAEVPHYPFLARAAGLTGTVHLRVQVKDGAVADTVADGSAHPILESAASKNVRTWRFGASINNVFDVQYVYELEGDAVSFPQNPRIEMQLPALVRITARPTKASCQDCEPSSVPRTPSPPK